MTETKDWNPWKGIDQNPKESDKDKAARLQLNKDHHTIFTSESGKRVLEYYKAHTVDLLTWYPGAPEHHAEWRTGQNSIIKEMSDRTNFTEEE